MSEKNNEVISGKTNAGKTTSYDSFDKALMSNARVYGLISDVPESKVSQKPISHISDDEGA